MNIITQEHSLKTLSAFCSFLQEKLPNGGIVLLEGNLAAGKTTLVKEFAKFLHVQSEVSSPTFSVLNEYEKKIKHYDIYQIGLEGFLQQGLLETLGEEEKYYFIEWADESFEQLLQNMGFEFIKIKILPNKDAAKRIYEVSVYACA